MIHYRAIGHAVGYFLVILAGTMLLPVAWGIARQQPVAPLLWSFVATAAAGTVLTVVFRRHTRELGQRDALMLTVLLWFSVSAFGALPFYLTPYYPSYTDAFFEAASGFTTTGATVLANVEVLPEPIQFWRCFSHWLGGLGIVLLVIAVLPLVGHGGMLLYRAEFSGAKSERLRPRVTETAIALWKIYVLLSVAQYAALRLAGLNAFDAICHTFATLGTGGFSTRTASVAGFQSPLVEWIVIVFMLLAGISFVQHHRLFMERKPGAFVRDFEIRAYVLLAVAATGVIFVSLVWQSGFEPARALRAAAFQVVSIQTTTGFATEDFELWAPLPHVILFGLMYVGGCTGSTAGGLKVARVVLLVRVVAREFKRMVERKGVFAVRLGGQAIPEPVIQSLLNLIYLALLVSAVGAVILAAAGVDMLTAGASVVACMFNIGPGFGLVGPSEHYGHLPAIAKWTLATAMIAGRLEFYTLIVILTPAFWRR